MSSQNERTNERTPSKQPSTEETMQNAETSRIDEVVSPAESESEITVTTCRTDVEEGVDGTYDCNICLGTAKNAVLTFCGHLYCWSCIYECLRTRPDRQVCPLCRGVIESEMLIPIYGRNSVSHADPKNGIPPRPEGLRLERKPQRKHNFRFMSTVDLCLRFMVILLMIFCSLLIVMVRSVN